MENINADNLISKLFLKRSKGELPLKKRIIAVIPVYNEAEYIEEVVSRTKKYTTSVIVVDDASTDQTVQLAKNAGAIVLKHAINLQKGAALKTGCDAAIMLRADSIITLDGDSQHDPNEIPKFIEKLKEYDIVIGTREFRDMPFNPRLGNTILSILSKILLKNKIYDTQTGFRAFNTKIYPKITWNSNNYTVETEMIKNIKKYNIPYTEVKIKTIYKEDYKGTSFTDGIKIALNMIKWRFKQ